MLINIDPLAPDIYIGSAKNTVVVDPLVMKFVNMFRQSEEKTPTKITLHSSPVH